MESCWPLTTQGWSSMALHNPITYKMEQGLGIFISLINEIYLEVSVSKLKTLF